MNPYKLGMNLAIKEASTQEKEAFYGQLFKSLGSLLRGSGKSLASHGKQLGHTVGQGLTTGGVKQTAKQMPGVLKQRGSMLGKELGHRGKGFGLEMANAPKMTPLEIGATAAVPSYMLGSMSN